MKAKTIFWPVLLEVYREVMEKENALVRNHWRNLMKDPMPGHAKDVPMLTIQHWREWGDRVLYAAYELKRASEVTPEKVDWLIECMK